MEDFYIMKKRNKIVAFLLAGVIAAGHGSVVYAAGYGMTKQTSKNVNHRRVHLNMLISVSHPC